MKTSLTWEKRFFKKKFKKIVGLDEVGRGALAGPIFAAAVIFNLKNIEKNKKLSEIKDSKKLSEKQREKLFTLIKKNCLVWAVAKVREKQIDRIGIGRANQLVFEKLIKRINPEIILADGQIFLKSQPRHYYPVIKGDEKVFSIAAASILAKVSRDRWMIKMDKKYPNYNFKKHKGYGTKAHYLALKKNGPCPCHRLSFRLK